MKTSDISVIIPVYNRYHSFKLSLESVLSQTSPAGEVIVVDDGSDEQTALKIRKLCSDKNVRLIVSDRNRGVSHARNIGIKKSKGSYIALLDSDDLWDSDKLLLQAEYMSKNKSCRIMQSEERWLRNGKILKPKKHHKKPHGDIWYRSLELCLVSPSAVLVEKKLLFEVGLFDENMRSCEDYDLWLRISRWHEVGLDSKKTVTKIGGHRDQLSAAFERIDDFRVYSLVKNMIGECSKSRFSVLKMQALKKIKILKSGAIKRGLGISELSMIESQLIKDRIIPVFEEYKNIIENKY